MNFKKWMNDLDSSIYIGKVVVFYLPINKIKKEIRKKIHNFFVKNYYAYTHEVSNIKGYWSKNNKIIKDEHEKYEVSFKGRKNLNKFINFISEICSIIKEDSIYLNIGGESYLIKPNKQ